MMQENAVLAARTFELNIFIHAIQPRHIFEFFKAVIFCWLLYDLNIYLMFNNFYGGNFKKVLLNFQYLIFKNVSKVIKLKSQKITAAARVGILNKFQSLDARDIISMKNSKLFTLYFPQ
jgi:hypothetical protein